MILERMKLNLIMNSHVKDTGGFYGLGLQLESDVFEKLPIKYSRNYNHAGRHSMVDPHGHEKTTKSFKAEQNTADT